MPLLNAPSTLAIGQAIVAYAAAIRYANNNLVYSTTSLGAIKDVTDLVTNSAVCLEVYANTDDSQHHAFGGRVRDEQSWFLLSLVNMDDSQAAEQLIYNVRDALIQPFQTHATLGNAGSVFDSRIKPNSGKFVRVFRNGQELRGHLIEIVTRQEWQVPSPGVVS